MSKKKRSLQSTADFGSKKQIKISDLNFSDLFQPRIEEGRLLFNQRRTVLFDVEAIGALRQQLLETLGESLARGVLARFGYSHGYSDAQVLQERFEWKTEADWLAAGPFIHMLEGVVQVEPEKVEFDRQTGHFHMQGIWRNSYEAEEHLRRYGPSDQPVCWTLTGYASGYASSFFGRDLLAIETACVGQGDDHCCWEIRPVEEWGAEAEPYLEALEQVDVAGQLFESNQRLQIQAQRMSLLNEMAAELSRVSDFKEVLQVAAAKTNLIIGGDRASIALPVSSGDEVELFALEGIKKAILVGSRLPVEGSAVGTAIRDNKVIVVEDIRTVDYLELPELADQGLRSVMTVPLRSGGRVIGALNVGSQKSGAFDASRDENLMLQIASLLASAIENRRLLEQVQERASQLEETESFLNSVIEHIPMAVFVKDAQDLNFVYWNKSSEALFGFSRQEMLGKNDYDFFPKEQADFFTDKDRQVLASGQPQDIPEEPIQVAGGETRLLHTRKVPIIGTDGKPKYLLVTSRDITERKQTEEALQESEARNRTLLEAVPDLMVRLDKEGIYLDVKPGEDVTTVISVDEMVGKSIYDILPEAVAHQIMQAAGQALETDQTQSTEYQLVMEGKRRYREARAVPSGKDEVLILMRDISERKRAEEALQLTQISVNQSTDSIFWITSDARLIFVNEGACQNLGYSREELTALTVHDLDPNFTREIWPHHWEELKRNKSMVVETEHRRKDGYLFPVEVRINYLKFEGKEYNYALARDITERKQAEEAQRRLTAELESERSTLQAVLENIPVGVFVAEVPSGKPLLTNKRAEEMLGRGISPDATPEDLAEVYGVYRYGTDEPYPQHEMPLVRGMGGEVATVDDMEIRRPDGVMILVQVLGAPIADAAGQIVASVAIFQDITERKQAEEMLAKRATELQTVAQVGTAASTILDVGELLQQVADLTKERFGLYHAHIYLLDEVDETLNLAAGAGEVGRQMVAEGWRIPLDREQSLVARAARTQQGVIVNNVREDPGWLPNPLLPDTHSEMAVPMIVGDRTVGVLDVQSAQADRFTDEDVRIKTTLAAQVAVAMENARLFEETRKTGFLLGERIKELDCLNDLGREMEESPSVPELLQWTTERIPPGMQYPELCQVAIEYEGQVYGKAEAIKLPAQMTHGLYIGGEVIGRVYIAYTEKHDFLDEESALLGGVANRLSGYIENRRLFEQTEARARREQTLREVTDRVRGSADVDTVMRMAAREVGRVLGRPTFVYLGNGGNQEKLHLPIDDEDSQDKQ